MFYYVHIALKLKFIHKRTQNKAGCGLCAKDASPQSRQAKICFLCYFCFGW